jgi:hypothetical protein
MWFKPCDINFIQVGMHLRLDEQPCKELCFGQRRTWFWTTDNPMTTSTWDDMSSTWDDMNWRDQGNQRVVYRVASLPCWWRLFYISSDIFTCITFVYCDNLRYFEPRGNARAFVLVLVKVIVTRDDDRAWKVLRRKTIVNVRRRRVVGGDLAGTTRHQCFSAGQRSASVAWCGLKKSVVVPAIGSWSTGQK